MKKNLFGFLKITFLSVLILLVSNFLLSNTASANSAILTDDCGRQLPGIINVNECRPVPVNGTITSPVCGKPYTRTVSVSMAGNACTLPKRINYTKYECGFAIPFKSSLVLVGIYGCGYNTYGLYSGSSTSFIMTSY